MAIGGRVCRRPRSGCRRGIGDPAPHDVRGLNASSNRVGRMGAAGGEVLAAAGLAWLVAQLVPPQLLPPQSPPSPASERTIDAGLPAASAPAPPATGTPALVGATPRNRAGSRPAPVEPKPPQYSPAAGIEASPLLVQPVGMGLLQTPVPQPRTPTDDAPATGGAETPPTGRATSQPLVADIVTPPMRIRTVSPEYPTVARAAVLEGDVLVQAIVGADGKVSGVQVLQAVHPLLDEAARKAVQQYEYAPGRRNGVPESAVVRITVSDCAERRRPAASIFAQEHEGRLPRRSLVEGRKETLLLWSASLNRAATR